MTLTVLEMNRIGADPQKGIDYFFKEKAIQDGKVTGSLETVDQQISLLASMDASLGSDQILESIDELKQIEVTMGKFWPLGEREMRPKWKNFTLKT